MRLLLILSAVMTVSVTGCQTARSLTQSDDSLSDRLNSPLNGDLQFAGNRGMTAPEPADIQVPQAEQSEGRWAGFWSKLKPSRPLSLPRTDFWPADGSSEVEDDSTALDSGF